MKIVFLTNNENSLHLARWLKSIGENVVVHNDRLSVEWVKDNKINFIISYNYKHMIKQDVLDECGNNAINLHISMLPQNRGADPNIWSFIKNTPKGVTIHRIDAGLDTGNILLQKEIVFDEYKESFASSYEKLQFEICNLFKENWENLKNNKITEIPQSGIGSYHKRKELDSYREKIRFDKPISEVLLDLKCLV